MIPVHPVAGPEPQTLLWRLPAGTLAVRGPVLDAPALGELLSDGTVRAVVAAADHVQVTLAAGREWGVDGGRVRTALLAALDRPEYWRVSAGAPLPPGEALDPGAGDTRLYAAAVAAVEGSVGDIASSHGGSIELVSVTDGVVTVQLRGACDGCPAAGLTLHERLERELRESCPELREVRAVEAPAGRRLLTLWPRSTGVGRSEVG